MKLCKVTNDTVVIPVLPKIGCFDLLPDTIVSKRYVYLHYREYEGRIIAAAYDRETDTLFVKDD
jgi:hypothetical protein